MATKKTPAELKAEKQIQEAIASYEKYQKTAIESGSLVPFIVLADISRPEFDIRDVKYTRNNEQDFEVFKLTGRPLLKITNEDFATLVKGGKVKRSNYGVTAADSATLLTDLSVKESENEALQRKVAELEKQLKTVKSKDNA